jgi:SAM-dependent methyltransferase
MDARAWDERYAASGLLWSATPNQFVEAELSGLRPGRALDLAAGEGRNAIWLAERGWEVTAVDFSLVGLDKGRTLQERHPRGRDLHVDWVHADALTYEGGPVPFDLVVVAYLQLPADERRTAVRRAFGALRVGGTFFLVAHDSTNFTEGTGGPTDPAVLYTAEEVLADLDGERFQVERAERVERLVPPADPAHTHEGEATRTAYDSLVRLVRTD